MRGERIHGVLDLLVARGLAERKNDWRKRDPNDDAHIGKHRTCRDQLEDGRIGTTG